MSEYFFTKKTIEENRDHFLLTYSYMRDESYALKYVILMLDEQHQIKKITFTSPEGRVSCKYEKGITDIDVWEDETDARMMGGMTKNFPLPTLAGSIEKPELAEKIIRNTIKTVEDADVRGHVEAFLEQPDQDLHVDVKQIENLVFL